jgi:alkyldihydroxyacetonephosphate synthase
MQSDRYGDIADIARGLRVVRPGDVLVLRPLPSTSSGPSVREMILGSEGRLGVITEVTVQIHRIPAKREILAYLYPTWDAGLAAMREISESDATPSITRVSDGNETLFSFATSKMSKGFSALAT